ncbi:HAMP domain-containing histidine kinase [Pseudohalioglobus sediminis]|uniref:histidine kinase n=1 Tax=Pseudohalioglobus sediminis TaxID=2606449 RepID=A0A5B0X4T1_9GAMM|nr:HAMP domain-containing sensor histidine kinase [Pseudohalioglobus sediminis]KAA1194410.1 HAMP domain-containing histidine kinase [Pseudohalioglobus sediminis]
MSLRRRLTLSLVTILILFSINVGTHFWGSFARNESMEAYRNSVTAAQLSTEVEQLLNDKRQTILVLDTIRDNTDDELDEGELLQAREQLEAIRQRIRQLGRVSHDVTRLHYDRLQESSNTLLDQWMAFYENYNNPEFGSEVNDPVPYLQTSEHLKELEQRQAFISVQRANIIDRTIALTDRITVIGFIASIFLTAILGFFLVRYTNRSLKHLKRGTERIGSGDLNYRIDNIDDSGELGDLANAFNEMSEKLRNAMYDVSKARDSADEANAAKSIFLANVSHELRTPLNAIIGYSEMLHDELSDENALDRQQFQQDLEKIIRSGRQLLTLINDILDLSKIETGKMMLYCETFQPGDLLEQACDAIRPQLRERNNTLHRPDTGELPTLYNDATKFRQIFTNLLSNACKFTENGQITVTAREPAEHPGWVEVSVRDTGIGMNEEQQQLVFEAFVQADSSTSANYGGTGLGLSICRDYCELMGGNIQVESAPGEGSKFTVLLPSDPELALEAA